MWHRDIKPAKLIVTNTGQLKVTDFGIARIESVVLTQITSTIGTPGYMAPEQYIGEGVDHRIDIFAAGAILYGMLVGHPPFKGSPETVMYKVVNEHPTPPSQVPGAGRPAFYDAIVAKALAHADKVLTSHIGPIASIVLKKAAVKARTQEQLFVLLAEQVGEGAERDKLLAALRKKP